jgi:hypothetical protein
MLAAPDRPDRPRFRQDLVAEPIEEQGARFIDVMDPESGNIFRFYEVEYSLACGMDGERDVPGIVKWAQDELGLTPSPHEVRAVIATLGDLGFIEGAAASETFPPPGTAPELAASIVVGAPSRPPPVPELELGAAGPVSAGSHREPARPAADIALGAAGGAARRAPGPTEDVPLGTPGARGAGRPRVNTPLPASAPPPPPPPSTGSAVSIDLSDHVAVRPDDVKEAVRASKVMAAVDPVPPGRDPAGDRPPASPGRASAASLLNVPRPRSPTPLPSRPPESRPPDVPAPRPLEGKPPAPPSASASAAFPTPGAMPAQPMAADSSWSARPALDLPRPPVEPPGPPSSAGPTAGARTSGAGKKIAIAVVIAAVLAAAGFVVGKYVIVGQDSAVDSSATPVAPPVRPLPPAPPPPPPPPSAKIALELPPPDELSAPRNGVIETILPDQSTVKEGDVVVRLVGDRSIEAELTGLGRDRKRLQDLIDAATKRRDTAQAAGNRASETAAQTEIATRQGQLANKQSQLENKQIELEKFLIHAPTSGSFAPASKLGQKIIADDVIARIQREASPIATFKLADTKAFSANASVELATSTGQRVTCTIAAVDPSSGGNPGSIRVACPAEPALVDGASVTLKLPGSATAPEPASTAPAGAAPPETPPAAPDPAGSAASTGSAAPAPPK